MPPLPFPVPLRIGTDLCNVSRIRSLITKKQNGKAGSPLRSFLSRILTHPERSYFWQRFGNEESVAHKSDDVARFLAGRFAAKEACRKACDHLDKYTRGFKHIVIFPVVAQNLNEHQSSRPQGLVLREALSEPEERMDGDPAMFDVDALEGQFCEISISHDGDYASAVALVPSLRQVQSHAARAGE